MSVSENPVMREAYFIQKASSGDGTDFINVTNFIGGELPKPAPLVTIAVESRKETVGFLVNVLTKKKRSEAGSQVVMPKQPLAALARRAQTVSVNPGEIVMELRSNAGFGAKDVTTTWVGELYINSEGVASILSKDTPFETFEHPIYGLNFQVYFKSPVAPRVIGVSFTGFQGRGGDLTSPDRVGAKILFQLVQLSDFRLLAGFEAVAVPAPPSRPLILPFGSKPDEKVSIDIPVDLYREDKTELASGYVNAEVDLSIANPATGRFVIHYTPSSTIEEHFPLYKDVLDLLIMGRISGAIGAEGIKQIALDIVLGSVTTETSMLLRDALSPLRAGLGCSPSEYFLVSA